MKTKPVLKDVALIEATVEAAKLSKQNKEVIYSIVETEDGDFNVFAESVEDDRLLHSRYLNGSKLKSDEATVSANVASAKSKKSPAKVAELNEVTTNKKTKTKVMATTAKKSAKKAVKKAVNKVNERPALKTIVGEKKTLTVKVIHEMMKKGKRIYRQSNPNAGGILLIDRIAKYKNKENTIDVIIRKEE